MIRDDNEILKALSYAYCDWGKHEFEEMQHRLGRFENEEDRRELEAHLVFAATFWLKDPLREDVDQVIADLKRVGTETKILSGDHEATVNKTVEKLGMLDNTRSTISASEFRKFMEPIFNKDTREFTCIEAAKEFTENFKDKVHSIYRCNPEDKLMFVQAMNLTGSFCAYTGVSISDASALSAAYVSMSMGKSGCAVTHHHSDIIILDDNFSSVKNAFKWGRNIFDNARKFIQY